MACCGSELNNITDPTQEDLETLHWLILDKGSKDCDEENKLVGFNTNNLTSESEDENNSIASTTSQGSAKVITSSIGVFKDIRKKFDENGVHGNLNQVATVSNNTFTDEWSEHAHLPSDAELIKTNVLHVDSSLISKKRKKRSEETGKCEVLTSQDKAVNYYPPTSTLTTNTSPLTVAKRYKSSMDIEDDDSTRIPTLEELENQFRMYDEEKQVPETAVIVNLLQRMRINLSVQDNVSSDSLKEQLEIEKQKLKTEMERDVQLAFQQYEQRIDKLEAQLSEQKLKLKLTADISQHQHLVIADIHKKLDNIELALVKRSAILTGLSFSDNKEELLFQLQDFITTTLKTSASIEDVYSIGEKVPKPIVIQFGSQEEKRNVFRNKSKLQHVVGYNKQAVYLNDYLPTSVNEKKRRERDIIKVNKTATEGKMQIERAKGALKIGKETYKKKISVPSPAQILDLTAKEIQETLDVSTTKGQTINIQDCQITAYGMDVLNFQQIRQGYLKLKMLHAKARHIVCVYYLPGKQPYFERDFQDDGETGVGRAILEEMVKGKIQNKCIFAVRYCGEDKLGSKRIPSYINAVRELLKEHPYNTITKNEQRLQDKHPQQNNTQSDPDQTYRKQDTMTPERVKEKSQFTPKKLPRAGSQPPKQPDHAMFPVFRSSQP